MGSNKKDLEIIYNLQWKNGNGTSHNDKSNIVGMYDIPATTLNWETFKSYLLKNSGAIADDVKVSYLSSEDKEFPIESQLDFQIALYSFRQRARSNDVITLMLERFSDKHFVKRVRRSVEKSVATTPAFDDVPDWFRNFMKEYKREIVDEVTTSVVSAISSAKLPSSGRKVKENPTKRLRKAGENEKEIKKTLKLERKIEELEEKTNKIKEKKLALTRSAECHNCVIGLPNDTEIVMNATPHGKAEVVVTHMTGGEICRVEWLITNTGSVAWTSDTELRYAWGSEALKPIRNTLSCPLLQPGEVGSIIAFLETPNVVGEYESYWHFYHNGRRFGHWLGCHINVDAPPLKMLSRLSTSIDQDRITLSPNLAFTAIIDDPENTISAIKDINAAVGSLSNVLGDVTLAGSDSDNQSVISIADSNSSAHSAHSDEFVVVPIESETESNRDKPPVNIEESGYAYINIDGKKQAVPRMLLRKDYLETAEEVIPPESIENADSKRLFVFPLNCPGFEVVYPPNPMSDSILATAGSTQGEDEPQSVVKTEIEESVIETKIIKEDPIPPPINNPTFTTAQSMFSNVSIFPAPLNIPSITIPPPPPITIPVAPPPRIQMHPPRIFSYSPPSNANPGLFYSSPNATAPQFVPCGPPPNPNFSYPYVPSYIYPNLEVTNSPINQPPPPTQEGSERPTSPNNGPAHAHIIPETLVSGAVNVASSAINTARSVLNMFTSSTVQQMQPMPQMPPEFHQVDPNSPQEKALKTLQEMGFWNRDLNISLLTRFNNNIESVITELLP